MAIKHYHHLNVHFDDNGEIRGEDFSALVKQLEEQLPDSAALSDLACILCGIVEGRKRGGETLGAEIGEFIFTFSEVA